MNDKKAEIISNQSEANTRAEYEKSQSKRVALVMLELRKFQQSKDR